MRRRRKLLWLFVLLPIPVATVSYFASLYSLKQAASATVTKLLEQMPNASVQLDNVYPLENVNDSPLLATETGPIISFGSKITSLDWFGGKRWEIDIEENTNARLNPKRLELFPKFDGPKNQYSGRYFVNWSLNVQEKKLWLLSTSGRNGRVPGQHIILLNSDTGIVEAVYKIPRTIKQNLYFQIAALNSGKVLVYDSAGNWWENELLDPKTGTFTFNIDSQREYNRDPAKRMNRENVERNFPKSGSSYPRVLYLVPISNNVNVAVFSWYPRGSSQANGDLFLMLFDDQFRKINVTNTSSPWYDFIRISNVWAAKSMYTDKETRKFSRSYYRTLSNQVYFTAFDQFYVFFPNLTPDYGIKFANFDLKATSEQGNTNISAISSFTLDVNQNVFLKLFDDSVIYKLTIRADNINGTATFNLTTYYNIQDAGIELIRKYAKTFILYNVTNFSGSIMLINAKNVPTVTDSGKGEHEEFGVAASIIANVRLPSQGDSKGLLNTNQSFQKSADFTIDPSVLSSKLPSEIVQSDITLLNEAFFTPNRTTKPDGSLQYLPFEIKNIDDEMGSFTINVNLNQIPWFSNTLPPDLAPIFLTQNFHTTKTISGQVIWKAANTLDYNFRNTLPSKITLDDVNIFDPFQVNFFSQEIFQDNKLVYPKKEYEIQEPDDTNGTIKIKVTYSYLPLGVLNRKENVKTYTSENLYHIFKLSNPKKFLFVGQQEGKSDDINVKDVVQLKRYLASDLLPSYFINNQSLINFADFVNQNLTTGYPVNKMTFDFTPDDENGTLIISAKLPTDYYKDGTLTTFSQKFTGFNRLSDYRFAFKTDAKMINQIPFQSILASNVKASDVIAYLVDFNGYNPLDFQVQLAPNNNLGSLQVNVILSNSYVRAVGQSQHGFNNYQASYVFHGFLTNEMFNNTYNVSFKNNNDQTLVGLKRLTPLAIANAFNSSRPLQIGQTQYTNAKDLVENLLVATKGSMVPKNWANNPNIEVTYSFNNQAGTISFFVKIKKEALNNYFSDLYFVSFFDGLVKGNIVPTTDNLAFISNEFLTILVPEVKEMNSRSFVEWIKDKTNLRSLFLNIDGQYNELFANDQYILKVESSDLYNVVSVSLVFKGVTNPESLKEYSVQYRL